MWWLVLGVAVPMALGGAPAGVDLENPSAWEAESGSLLDGPPGCWEVVGRADWDHSFGRYTALKGTAVFAGRLDEGAWVDLHVEPLGEIRSSRRTETRVYDDERHFFPLIGRSPGGSISVGASSDEVTTEIHADADDEPEAVNGVRGLLDEMSGQVEMSWVSWDDERGGVVLHRTTEVDGAKGELVDEILFPGGGLLATEQDVVFPKVIRVNDLPPVRIRDAVVRVRGQAAGPGVFPLAEAFSFTGGVLGMEFTLAQTIRYLSARACPTPRPQR